MNKQTLLWLTACIILLGLVIYQSISLQIPPVQAQCTVTDPSGCEGLIALNSERWQSAEAIKMQAEQENAIYRSILSLHDQAKSSKK